MCPIPDEKRTYRPNTVSIEDIKELTSQQKK